MKLVIAGSRHLLPPLEYLDEAIERNIGIKKITRVISGGARGVDLQGEKWAEKEGLPYIRFVPGWGLHGRKYAAYIRNNDMGFYGDGLLAIWDGRSPGTKHMITTMVELNKPHWIEIYTGDPF